MSGADDQLNALAADYARLLRRVDDSEQRTRDMFAAHAMQALVATTYSMVIDEGREGALNHVADVAYQVADALMAERARRAGAST